MPQAKNHLTASTQAKNGSLHAVIQYKDENGKRKNKWKSLGLKEGASICFSAFRSRPCTG